MNNEIQHEQRKPATKQEKPSHTRFARALGGLRGGGVGATHCESSYEKAKIGTRI